MSEKQPWEIWRDTSKTIYTSEESAYGRYGTVDIGIAECEMCNQTTTIMSIDGSDGEYRSFNCCKPCMMKLWEQA